MAARRETPWSIVVGMASFLSQVMCGGLVGTSGLYYPYFQSAFQSSGTATSWLCSMTFVGFFVGNTLGSIFVNRFGYRACAVFGGLASSIGLCLCLFASNFYQLFLFYGLLGCIGNGIYSMGFLVALISYFDKHMCSMQVFIQVGSGVGFAVYSVLIPNLIQNYGWRGSIFLQGGIGLNIAVLGMLLFKRGNTEQRSSKRLTLNVSLLLRIPVLLFCLHEFFAMISQTATFVHLPVLVISQGFQEAYASMTYLCYAVSNVIGKLTYSFPWKGDRLLLYTVTVLVYGISALCQPFLDRLVPIFICSGVAGFAGNCFAGYTTVVILELVGTAHYTDAHGIIFLFRAAGSITSGPMADLSYDMTQRYENVFFLIAILINIGCLLMNSIITDRGRNPCLCCNSGLLYDMTQRYENVFFMIAILISIACLLMLPIIIDRRRNPVFVPIDDHVVEPGKVPIIKERSFPAQA